MSQTPLSNSPLSNSPIDARYLEKTPGSADLAAQAETIFPSGIVHDGRFFEPYGIYVDHAKGARKWDVDGNEYIDYFGGHGALILGHNPPEMVAAVTGALQDGTHFGANHPREVRWGRLVIDMVPCAERVRFTSSGTEATLMALRLARAWTGRDKILRFKGHFHGWHDHMTSGYVDHFDASPTPGVLAGLAENVLLIEAGDTAALERVFDQHPDIAAVIIEPTGGSYGMVPVTGDFLAHLREVTRTAGTVLIFDEVITGFRVSPGGAQAHYGVTPDLATFAKALAGGLPGGALAGRKDILDLLDFKAMAAAGREKIAHPGTFNGNPLSAAAGIATLEVLRSTDACQRANDFTTSLRAGMNQIFASEGVPWAAYGTFSALHVFTNPGGRPIAPAEFDPLVIPLTELKGNAPVADKFRKAMFVNGVDLGAWPGGLTSAAHGEAECHLTLDALARSIAMLKAEGDF